MALTGAAFATTYALDTPAADSAVVTAAAPSCPWWQLPWLGERGSGGSVAGADGGVVEPPRCLQTQPVGRAVADCAKVAADTEAEAEVDSVQGWSRGCRGVCLPPRIVPASSPEGNSLGENEDGRGYVNLNDIVGASRFP